MDKIKTLEFALEQIRDGMTVMIGGFLGVGTPEMIIDGLVEKNVKDLCIIGNDTGFPNKGIGKLIVNKSAKKVMVSHIGTNPETGRQMNAGETEVVLIPQGTLIEQIRAGGAGLGGVLTPTGKGTLVEQGKRKIEVDGKEYLLEMPIRANVALVKAHQGDKYGNLKFRKTARNFNPTIALAADLVIVEAEEIVEVLDPECVVTPGIFVDIIVKGEK